MDPLEHTDPEHDMDQRILIRIISLGHLTIGGPVQLDAEYPVGETMDVTIRDETREVGVALEVTRSWARYEQGVRTVAAGSIAKLLRVTRPAIRIAETDNMVSARLDS